MEFSLARDATARYQELRNTVMCNSEHGLVRPVEIVDVSDVIPRTGTGDWFKFGGPILIVYGTDPGERRWYASLRLQFDGGGSAEIGFSGVGEPLFTGIARTVNYHVGLTLEDVAKLYRACIPDRIKQSVRDSGVVV